MRQEAFLPLVSLDSLSSLVGTEHEKLAQLGEPIWPSQAGKAKLAHIALRWLGKISKQACLFHILA